MGAVLSQTIDDKERVIAYFSSTLSRTQRRWSTYDRELWAIVAAVRHFRHYLRGLHFNVVTDHQPLLNYGKLPIQDDATGRRARWMVELHAYTFSIIHRRGRSHQNADALSRHPDSQQEPQNSRPSSTRSSQVCTLNATSYSSVGTQTMSELESEVSQPPSSPPNCLKGLEPKLLHHQKLDKDLEDIRHMVTNNTRPTVKEIRRSQPGKRRLLWQLSRLSIHNDILYRTKVDEKRSVKLYQAIVPESLVQEVLKLLHGHPTSGHFSAERTLERAKSSYFWPYMHRDVLDFCETCRACESIRSPNPSYHAPLKNISTSAPFQTVFADIAELPTTSKGHRYILVMVDHFTSMPICMP